MNTSLTLHRMAVAVRDAAAKLVAGETDLLRRQGYETEANVRESAAGRVRRMDLDAVVDEVTGQVPALDELSAFETAAVGANFNPNPASAGGYLHPVTQRAHAVWRAGVRFGAAQAAPAVDRLHVEWAHDMQTRLMELCVDQDPDVKNAMGEAACLLAAIAGRPDGVVAENGGAA